ncbi:DNA-processing protein DprA [Thiosulfativibrio zosterae]|uniref:DNA processing protein DprA n=1 Tax=Thiosulfativibrio zosterae TaxID=2675053 RepID=A0A6F8PQ59_9GAMM|nr:DNA-processing protein DprA [Thiosulfativibrio zosterae]BBP44261.1 DNA processing protein DprA [Thiosulfativibrio zosterae]
MSHLSEIETLLPFHFAGLKAAKLLEIESYFGSLAEARSAQEGDWQGTGLLTKIQAAKLFDSGLPALIEAALAWQEQASEHTLLGMRDEAYPHLLKDLIDAPILLYVKGQLGLLKDPQIALVGSRHASRLGVETAKDFAHYLSSVGLTITSGLASGIDAAAHQGGLLGQGSTVAVVGTGLDRVYPASNRQLARQIAEQGVLVSEYPLGAGPLAHHFPQRNRIISGLSTGVLVVEAALQSGSLITARLAMEQGREVFAVPGAINNPHAKGCHQLIKQGAKLVESGQDVLEELAALVQLSITENEPSAAAKFSEKTRVNPKSNLAVLNWIEYDPIGLDELVVLSKMPVSEIQSQLMQLEVLGEVEALSAGRWRRLS